MQKNESMSIEIYNVLKEKIITMDLMPGQVLITQQLSAENNISRTPVREALVRLESIGFVENAIGGKYRVTDITWNFIKDLYDVRCMFETEAIRNIIHSLSESDFNELEDYNMAMGRGLETGELDAFFQNDLKYHNFFLLKNGNQVVIDLIDRLDDSMQRIRYITAGIEGRMQRSLIEHQELVLCLRRHSEEEAVEMLKSHLRKTVDEMKALENNKFAVPSRIIKW